VSPRCRTGRSGEARPVASRVPGRSWTEECGISRRIDLKDQDMRSDPTCRHLAPGSGTTLVSVRYHVEPLVVPAAPEILRFPHCQNSQCRFHSPDPAWRYVRIGFFVRRSDHRRFHRYQCLHCGRTFSSRTFCADYWLLTASSCRASPISRSTDPGFGRSDEFSTSPMAPVGRHLARAGRHCLLFPARTARLSPHRRTAGH